jgi:hypothetical protein
LKKLLTPKRWLLPVNYRRSAFLPLFIDGEDSFRYGKDLHNQFLIVVQEQFLSAEIDHISKGDLDAIINIKVVSNAISYNVDHYEWHR